MASYIIKKGDTLSGIAASLQAQGIDTSVDALAKLNNISNVNLIRAGSTLNLPDAGESTADVGTTTDPNATAETEMTASEMLSSLEGNAPEYQQSDALKLALEQLAAQEAAKPADYVSPYASQIEEIIGNLLGRQPFKYDMNSDPTYQQYKDAYMKNGQQAMMNTMGQAAGLTGGYGNTYAQTAGQQAYNAELGNLNDVVPELYQLAYGKYTDEGDQMTQNLGVLQGMDESEYGRYRDSVDDWQSDLNYLYNKSNNMSEDEYNRYLNDRSAWEADRAYWYNKSSDEAALAAAASGSGGSRRSSSGGGGDPYDDLLAMTEDYSLTYDDINDAYANGFITLMQKNALISRVDAYATQYGPADSDEFADDTGYSIASEAQFNRSRDQTGGLWSQYDGSYAAYVAAMYKRYGS